MYFHFIEQVVTSINGNLVVKAYSGCFYITIYVIQL